MSDEHQTRYVICSKCGQIHDVERTGGVGTNYGFDFSCHRCHEPNTCYPTIIDFSTVPAHKLDYVAQIAKDYGGDE